MQAPWTTLMSLTFSEACPLLSRRSMIGFVLTASPGHERRTGTLQMLHKFTRASYQLLPSVSYIVSYSIQVLSRAGVLPSSWVQPSERMGEIEQVCVVTWLQPKHSDTCTTHVCDVIRICLFLFSSGDISLIIIGFEAVMTTIPATSSMLSKMKLPLAIHIHPYKDGTPQVNIIIRHEVNYTKK